jgi:thioredoxin 1
VPNCIDVDNSNFKKEVLEANGFVLVDFWAAWCGPCKMIAPLVEELAVEYKERLKVAKINVDANQELALQYQILSIPSLVIFKDGQEIDRMVGFIPKEALKRRIDALI